MAKKRNIIGIPGYSGKDSNNFGVGNFYLEFFSQFGDVKILMPWEDLVPLDLLVLPGGLDVNPANYNEAPRYLTSNTDVFKEHFFTKKLPLYLEQNTPIFGICLGLQQLAVHFGSKLTQNLIEHPQSPRRWAEAHPISDQFCKSDLDMKGRPVPFSFEEFESGIINLKVEKTAFKVNSHHHQGVLITDLNMEELNPLYFSEYYNNLIVEAFEHKTKPIAAVQWHPEEFYDPMSRKLIENLLK